jgi:hypothetical protein
MTVAKPLSRSALTICEIRGGPSLRELRARLKEALEQADQDSLTAAEIFADSSNSLKRPVEILGLIQIAADAGVLDFDGVVATDTFEAVRPDGSERSFDVPRMTFHRARLKEFETQEGDRNA